MMKNKKYIPAIIAAILIAVLGVVIGITMNKKNATKKEEVVKLEIDETQPYMIVFYTKNCPFCHKALEFISKNIEPKYKELKVYKYDLDNNKEMKYFSYFFKKFDLQTVGVPLVIVGEKKYEMGFGSETGDKYIKLVTEEIEKKISSKK